MNIEELAFKDRRTLVNLNELDLLNIIEFLQIDRKQWINQFSKTHNESVDIQKENQELKERLEEYKKENKKLTKDKLEYLTEYCEMLTSQGKFIKYLEDEIEQKTPNVRWKHYNEEWFCDYDVENPTCIEVQPTNKVLKEVLQKYKEIIGDDK